jgi:hypothetical protein
LGEKIVRGTLALNATRFAPKAEHIGAKIGVIRPSDRVVFQPELTKVIRIGQWPKYRPPKRRRHIKSAIVAVAKAQLDRMILHNIRVDNSVDFGCVHVTGLGQWFDFF